ncbi:hypothetical protein ACEUAK_21005 [Aeromonas veronii]|uniref:hypothetical protein n=1 Tax=Aeromonas veronii TaxID=654 RepID=UPI0014305280|nr:hypothetical protein [Aeromonas veronii]NJI21320.1 hypothetical protein [Aeromonas veronii]
MKSGNFCCNRRCQLVKSAARDRSALAQADILDSAVQPLGGDQFQQIQPMAAMVDRGQVSLIFARSPTRKGLAKRCL